nr:Crp/Fnr family transcriptional regulator [uncultured Chryseobacterium sp.]
MIINKQLLLSYGGQIERYKRGETIFLEGTTPKYYFQILEGTVRISTVHNDGKEFVHGFPFEGHCFGESYLFTEKDYAINAVAEQHCSIIKIAKNSIFDIFDEQPDALYSINKYSAERLHFRYIISSFLAITDPTVKIEILFRHLKDYFTAEEEEKSLFHIPYTRKQIASLTGLRLETIVRVVKRMNEAGTLKVIDKKIYF